MSELSETTELTDDRCETCNGPIGGSKNFRALETKAAALADENATLRTLAMSNAIKAAGFPSTEGLVSLVVEKFIQQSNGATSLTSDAFIEFAKGYGLEPPTSSTPPPPEKSQGEEAATALDVLQGQADAVRAGTQSPGSLPKSREEKLAEARSKGDADAEFALNNDWLLQLVRQNAGVG